MGEYAKYRGESIKIGTCEDLYYLRADQAAQVVPEPGSVDPVRERDGLRFRFPFPSEDDVRPGQFEDPWKGFRIPGWSIPSDWADGHGIVQFTATAGYNLCIPCPEAHRHEGDTGATIVEGIRVNRNGWNGGPEIRQQRYLPDGTLATIVACRACGAKWRLPADVAEDVAVCLRAEADRQEWRRAYDYAADAFLDHFGWESVHSADTRREFHAVADRILAGYALAPVAA